MIELEDVIPKIYHDIAIKYPVSAEDLFFAVPDNTTDEIEAAGKLFSAGYTTIDVKRIMYLMVYKPEGLRLIYPEIEYERTH